MNGMTASREPQLQDRLSRIEVHISEQTKLLEELHVRLQGALRPSTPTPVDLAMKGMPTPPQEPVCPIAARLDTSIAMIRDAKYSLEDILSRLEI